MPELLAHTNMDSQAMSKLRDHIEEFVKWLAKDPTQYIANPYESGEYHKQKADIQC
jgi:mortality factor 4-like protein 1